MRTDRACLRSPAGDTGVLPPGPPSPAIPQVKAGHLIDTCSTVCP
ncbi:hypothetical protein I545_3092 [Mycobacterium kansasii 662]|uniref:Uncharacterized protein n=1 Tax=Mycobacterium kansasii 662 TaxID=1299326 RepID=X7ZET2_MYCKA|nr:hypothetical protein I545_3092 [Mycobacterium kansasii 662]KEP39649.1 hypothetical protein MKSMC1_52010 [Mycobacterium kansasii]